MPDIQFPVALVAKTGEPVLASTPAELWSLIYGSGCRLRRSTPGLEDVVVAESARAAGPREVTSWRGQPSPEPDVEPVSESSREPRVSRSRKSPRKG